MHLSCARWTHNSARPTAILLQASFAADAAKKIAAAGAAALLTLAPLSGAAIASEFDILAEPQPSKSFYVDDANVLSKSTRSAINKQLNQLAVRRSAATRSVPLHGSQHAF
jgi:hypothetical protein